MKTKSPFKMKGAPYTSGGPRSYQGAAELGRKDKGGGSYENVDNSGELNAMKREAEAMNKMVESIGTNTVTAVKNEKEARSKKDAKSKKEEIATAVLNAKLKSTFEKQDKAEIIDPFNKDEIVEEEEVIADEGVIAEERPNNLTTASAFSPLTKLTKKERQVKRASNKRGRQNERTSNKLRRQDERASNKLDRQTKRASNKVNRVEAKQEKRAGKARVARTKGNNALSNTHLSTEQKQRRALVQRKKYQKNLPKTKSKTITSTNTNSAHGNTSEITGDQYVSSELNAWNKGYIKRDK